MKSIIMVGGGVQSVKAVMKLQAIGYNVVVTDKSPNAACSTVADYFVNIDGRDVERLVGFTLFNKEKLNIVGVFTQTELVTSVAAISQAAELPGTSIKSAVQCQDKALCKKVWTKNKVPTPNGIVVNNYEQAVSFFNRNSSGVFIKPVIGSGSKNAKHILSLRELSDYFGNLENTGGGLLCEELLKGTMHDVNGFIDKNGKMHYLGISDRLFLNDYPVADEVHIPSKLSLQHRNSLYRLLEKSTKALGITFGPVKGDAVLSGRGFKMLEVAPRLHGPKTILVGFPSIGYNPFEIMIKGISSERFSLFNSGEISEAEKLYTTNTFALIKAILPKPGIIKGFSGIEEAKGIPGVEDIFWFAKHGAKIETFRTAADVPGYIVVKGKSRDECNWLYKTAIKKLKIICV